MGYDYSEITIKGDTGPLKGALDSAIGFIKGFGDAVKNVLGSITLTGGDVAGIWAQLKSGVQSLEASALATMRLDTALKNFGANTGYTLTHLKEMNLELQKNSKYNTDAITEAQQALMRFGNVRFNDMSNTFNLALKAAMDLAAGLGTDLTSAVNTVGAALQNPLEGMEDLAAEGVKFTTQQKQLIQALMETGQVVAAQKIILQGLSDAYKGSAAKEAGTFTSMMAKLGEVFDTVWKKIANAALPYLKMFVDVLQGANRLLEYYGKRLQEYVGGIIDSFMGGAKGRSVTDWFKLFAEWGVKAFSAVQAAIQEWQSAFIGGMMKLVEFVTPVFKKVYEVIMTWVEQVTPLVVTVWTNIVESAGKAFEKMREIFGPLMTYFKELGTWIVEAFGKVWQRVYEGMVKAFSHGIEDMKDSWSDWLKFKTGIMGEEEYERKKASRTERRKMGSGFDFGGMDFGEMPTLPGFKGFGNLGKDALDGLKEFYEKFKSGAGDIWDNLEKSMEPFLKKFGTAFAANSKSAEDFIKNMLDVLKEDPEALISGKDQKKGFLMPGQEGARGVGMEDLLSLNKRIQEASFKSPELRQLEAQTRNQLAANGLLGQIAKNTQQKAAGDPNQDPLQPEVDLGLPMPANI